MSAQLIESVGDPSKEAWIAVDLDGESNLPRDFLLGEGGRSRNNFINRPLRTTQTYRVFVRAVGQGSVDIAFCALILGGAIQKLMGNQHSV